MEMKQWKRRPAAPGDGFAVADLPVVRPLVGPGETCNRLVVASATGERGGGAGAGRPHEPGAGLRWDRTTAGGARAPEATIRR